MPDLTLWGLFVVASVVLLLTPGPAVLYIVARSVEQGRAAGLVSVLGYPSRHYHPHHRGGGRAFGPHRIVGACLCTRQVLRRRLSHLDWYPYSHRQGSRSSSAKGAGWESAARVP
jgi:hypothetical protein